MAAVRAGPIIDCAMEQGTASNQGDDRPMQVIFQPLQILSRLVAVCLVALPLASLLVAIDDYEREVIGKMTHPELIAFVKEAHSSSFLSAYLRAAVVALILVAVVEAVAFGIRLTFGLLGIKKTPCVREDKLLAVRVNRLE